MESLSKLGIDPWSILLYIVNMGLLLAVLSKYLFPKLLHFLDERRAKIASNLKEAESLKDEMFRQRELMEEEKKKFLQQIQDELSETKKSLDEKRQKAEAEITSKKAKMLEEVKTAIADEKEKLTQSVQKDIMGMVQRMVLHIVSQEVPRETVEKSVSKAWDQFKQ